MLFFPFNHEFILPLINPDKEERTVMNHEATTKDYGALIPQLLCSALLRPCFTSVDSYPPLVFLLN